MDKKKSIFKSKTFWVNLGLGTAAVITQAAGAEIPLDNETALTGLAIVNILLRAFTDKGVTVVPK